MPKSMEKKRNRKTTSNNGTTSQTGDKNDLAPNKSSSNNHTLYLIIGVLVALASTLYQTYITNSLNGNHPIFIDNDVKSTLHVTTKEEKMQRFLHWFVEMGGSISPSVTLGIFPEYGGYGIMARESDNGDIKYMQELFTTPSAIITSTESIFSKYRESNLQTEITSFLTKTFPFPQDMASQDIIISLELMVQCSLGNQSKLFPYLDILPAEIHRLSTFDEQELSLLQDEQLASLGKESKQKLQQAWNEDGLQTIFNKMLQSTTRQDNSIKSLDPQDLKTCGTFASFHRFVAVSSSRAMVLQGKKFLTPLADMMNYEPSPLNLPLQTFTKYHQQREDGSIIVRADRNVNAGTQITEDYGNVDNSLFLEAHGFVPHQNPSHCAMIPLQFFPYFHSLSEETRRILTQLKIINAPNSPPPSSICVNSKGKIMDKRAESYCSLLGIDDDKEMLSKCASVSDSDDMELIQMNCIRYEGHKKRIFNIVQKAAQSYLENENTSFHQDVTIIKDMEEQGISSMQTLLALKFRMQEKKLLHEIATHTAHNSGDNKYTLPSKISNMNSKSLSEKVEAFNVFLQSIDFPINDAEVKIVGDDMRIGVVATKDIDSDNVYLSVPTEWTISFETIIKMKHPDTFDRILNANKISQDKNMVVILYLMHERFLRQEKSKWWPYIDLLPTFDEMNENVPLFYPEEKVNMLYGSDLRQLIIHHQRSVDDTFIQLFSEVSVADGLGSVFTYDNFRWAYAILDSRSIWWNGNRHLVPLLDLVNCKDKIHASEKVHSTILDGTGKFAITKAARTFRKGEQIFENYGQPNYLYFLYHGFILDENSHDCALIKSLYLSKHDEGAKDIQKARERLSRIGIYSFSPTFCIRDVESLNNVANFLRIKHDMDEKDLTGISSDVKLELIDLLEKRLLRYENIERPCDNDIGKMSSLEHMITQMLQNEKLHFKKAIDELMEF